MPPSELSAPVTLARMGRAQVIEALSVRGGIASAGALLGPGVSRFDLGRAVSAESVVRLRSGVYALESCDPQVALAALHGGELACVSALRRAGVWVLAAEKTHVWLGAKGRAHPHAGCRCVDHHRAGTSGFGIVSIVDALIQSVSCAGAECFFAAFESAWTQGLLTRADRASVRAGISARHRWLVDLARPDAGSGLESILRLRLARLGIELHCQVWIPGVLCVDFVMAGRIVLEVDGRENHDGPSLRHKDLMRDAAAAALGYETLRFDYSLVIHHWPIVEAAILGRLRSPSAPVRRKVGAGVQ